MSKITLYGATGTIGQRIMNEALSRGHNVTAIVRDITKTPEKHPNLDFKPGDILKPESVAIAILGCDVVVSAFGPRAGDPQQIVTSARSLIEGIAADRDTVREPIRLIMVGGAGSLEVAPGVQLVDTPDFHPAWKGAALAHREALGVLRSDAPATGVDWTYVSPAAIIQPGERTGKYRTGTDQLVTNAKGESRISAEDYAVAIVDEIERPRHQGARFTVAY